jgi:hypothetical protein
LLARIRLLGLKSDADQQITEMIVREGQSPALAMLLLRSKQLLPRELARPLAAEWLQQAHRLDKFAKDTRGAMA